MKLIKIGILFLMLPTIGFSQIQKGKSFFVGSLGYDKSTDRNSFLSQSGIPPDLQMSSFNGIVAYNYFISSRISLGPIINWDLKKATYSEVIDVDPFTFEGVFKGWDRRLDAGLNIRYFHPISKNFYLYLSTSGSRIFIRQEIEYDNNSYIDDGRGIILSTIPGIVYVLNERWVINLSVGEIVYEKLFPKNQPDLYLSDFRTKFDLTSIRIGAQIHLGKRNENLTNTEEILVPLFDDSEE